MKLGKVLFIINILLILLDLTVYKPMRSETISYLYLYYSHILMVVIIPIWFLIEKLHRKYKNFLSRRILYVLLMNITMYWGVFLGLNQLFISGQISAHNICVSGISICLYLKPLENCLTYLTSLIIFVIGLILFVEERKVLYSHIVNVSIIMIISFCVSHLIYRGFVKDFVNRKHLLESKYELELTNQKLKESEKLRTDFFANISHELRTPLNVIYCSQQMLGATLEKKEQCDQQMNKYLKMIKQNSYRLLRLIGNLIDITKIDASSFDVKLVNTDIIKLVEDITLSVAGFVENKGLTFTFDTTIEEKLICCDPDKIERIVLNLLSNAVKFTEKGGSIFVNIYTEDESVCISVKDTGIGIPEEMKYLIFDRFIQVDKSTSKKCEGSGIGLALVKSLVEMHQGTIQVNSEIGQGSEFIIKLPDKVLSENPIINEPAEIGEDHVKRISIEFSDIYY